MKIPQLAVIEDGLKAGLLVNWDDLSDREDRAKKKIDDALSALAELKAMVEGNTSKDEKIVRDLLVKWDEGGKWR